MKYICQVDTALFADAIKARFEETGDCQVVYEGDGSISLCYYESHKAQYLANLAYADVEEGTQLEVTFEKKMRETPLPIGAKICARLTFELLKGGIVWGAVYGISYPMGNRSLLLPLIAPIFLWLIPIIKWCVKRCTGKKKVLRALEEMLGVQPQK